jgi:Regulator of G protein signaling domain
MSDKASTTSTPAAKETAQKRQAPVAPVQTGLDLAPAGLGALGLQRAMGDPRTARPAQILALQRKYGNQAVQRLLVSHRIQPKLNVGPAGDHYEQEADRVADQVLAMPAPAVSQPTLQRAAEEEAEVQTKPLAGSITPLVQRAAEEAEEVQTKPLAGSITPLVQRAAEEAEEVQTKPLAGSITPFVGLAGAQRLNVQVRSASISRAPHGRVQRSELTEYLTTPGKYTYFYQYADLDFSTENLNMWHAVRHYKKNPRPTDAQKIYDDFLSPDSKTEVNLPNGVAASIKLRLDQADKSPAAFAEQQADLFEPAMSVLLVNMSDSFARFKADARKTGLYKKSRQFFRNRLGDWMKGMKQKRTGHANTKETGVEAEYKVKIISEMMGGL